MIDKVRKISVIMSTYNRIEFLPRSIERILSQTFDNFEFILVNNGSTDGSDKLCAEYEKKDNRIKLINIARNFGAPIGRNAGLDAASCEYITIVDDDDSCDLQMLEFLWNLACEHGADISLCGSWNDYDGRLEPYYIFDELMILDKTQGLDELLKREKYNVAPPTKLFRKALFDDIRFKTNVLVDDIHIIYKVFANANTIAAKGKPLYNFTKHEGNMTNFIHTNKLTNELLYEYLLAFRERTKYLSKRVPEIASRARYSEWSYMISMCNKIKEYNYIESTDLYDFMVETIKANFNELINSPFIKDQESAFIKELMS